MSTAANKLMRFLPPVLALAALGGACLWEVDRVAARSRGYGDKQVVINELCAHNLSGLQDGNGNCGDWIELYNPGGGTVELSGWTLTDDKDDPGRWTFPEGTVLEEYLVLFADGTGTVDGAGYCHTSFSLKTRGETLYLYNADGELVDRLKYPEQGFDITYGRAFGNGEDKGTFATATPGAANPADFLDQHREASLGRAEFSLPSGFYDEPVAVELSADDPDALIFYTTDGSDPADGGTLYTGPVTVENRAGEPNEYASLPSRFGYGYSEFIKNYAYDYAPDPVDKATTLTVRLYKDGQWSDECSSATYWVGVEPHTLPVVSVTADPDDLFGPEGIYTPGTSYFTAVQQGQLDHSANFMNGEDIDARIQVEGLAGNEALEAEISVGGQASRMWSLLKNLSVRFDEESRQRLEETADLDDLAGFSLKGPGNGSWQYFYVDGFWSNYLYQKNLGSQYSIPVILYLEDEYWGIYCIRPSKDETFVADQFGVDADAVTIIATGRDDTEQQVFDLAAQVEALPTDEASWQWLNETFDVPGFIDYLIPHIYSNNWDGVRTAGNTILWKADAGSSARYTDGKWRFLFNDFDQTMNYGFMDSIDDLLNNPADDGNVQRLLFQKLWQYEEFRAMFAEKFRAEMTTTYAPENILPAFEAWCEELEPEMERNITRQKVETTLLAPLADKLTDTQSDVQTMTMEQWQADYATLCDFLENRADDLLEYLDANLAEAETGIGPTQ